MSGANGQPREYGVSRFGYLKDFLTRYALRKAGPDPEKEVRSMRKRWRGYRVGFMIFSVIILASVLNGTQHIAQAALAARAKPELTKLSIGLPVPALTFLPAWVADQKGFLKEEGIPEVKVLAFRGDADVVQALAAGTTDINIASLIGLVGTITSG